MGMWTRSSSGWSDEVGQVVKDGFAFVAYANAGLIRKIDDIPELKTELINLSEGRTKLEMSRYALLLAEHVLEISGLPQDADIGACFAVVAAWQRGEVRFQDALEVAGALNRRAREEKNPVYVKALRALGQIAATPHVRWHPLVASEYAVVLVNLLYPGDMERVREERYFQIGLMRGELSVD